MKRVFHFEKGSSLREGLFVLKRAFHLEKGFLFRKEFFTLKEAFRSTRTAGGVFIFERKWPLCWCSSGGRAADLAVTSVTVVCDGLFPAVVMDLQISVTMSSGSSGDEAGKRC